MKNKLLHLIMAVALVITPTISFGQAAPNLGTSSSFALFTAAGAFDNVGATNVTGNVGTKVGAFAGFGTPVGSPGTLIGSIHVADPTSVQAGTDVLAAYGELSGTTDNFVLGTPLENQILTPGVYHSVGAAALNGEITLDAQNNPNAIFIIKINGALTVGVGSNVKLINSASLCNVYWQIYGGAFELGAGSVFRGTIIASGQIELLEASSLFGRGLSTSSAIHLHNNAVNFLPEAAGIITGTAAVCQRQIGVSYSVPIITNATSYIWSLPDGATIVAGVNTNAVTVDFSAIAVSGNITVQGSSSCGNGTVSPNFAVTVNPLPAAVAGVNRAICLNTSTQIGATAVTGSTYSWTSVPAGFSSTAANPTITPFVTTTYTVVETITATGCNNTNSVFVTVNPLPATSLIYHNL